MYHELGLWAWHLEWLYWATQHEQLASPLPPWSVSLVGVIHGLGELLVFDHLRLSGAVVLFGHARCFYLCILSNLLWAYTRLLPFPLLSCTV